eukprot:TRINITY_DN3925_c0_g1_i2.p1 TRINITY_DN3925_c0_g1~~TRINITY_DN3925_c0_g1_i2.p1  ORF type:complete len:199 (+),score=51.90 TRINITY_DN3925_c0_g1_i2:74-670(+)
MYRKSRFQCLKQDTFWLSETPHEVSKGWDAKCIRICTWGHFKDKTNEQEFWVFNTHLDHMGKKARLEGMRVILEMMKEITGLWNPIFLCGDFNDTPGSELLKFIESRGDGKLAFQLVETKDISKSKQGPQFTFVGFDMTAKETIDYIFLYQPKATKLEVEAYYTISNGYVKGAKTIPSDHLPIKALCNWNASAQQQNH